MSLIFGYLSKYKIKVSLMQNSAISLALCLEDKFNQLEELNEELQKFLKLKQLKMYLYSQLEMRRWIILTDFTRKKMYYWNKFPRIHFKW